jgi:hypothetical protein
VKHLSFLIPLLLLAGGGTALAAGTASSPEQVHPLPIGAEVPELSLRDVDGAAVDLRAAVTEQPTVLIFYRGGW